MTANQLQVNKDVAAKTITVSRRFNAPVEQIWRAWTESELLDQWWAPKPWKAETKEMDFREGGHWLYAMAGPDGEKQWAKVLFQKIEPQKSFSAVDMFCDETGQPSGNMPQMQWHNRFEADGEGTKVTVEIKFENESDMNKILEMGFEQGFAAGLQNLEDYLENQLQKP